VWSCVDVIAMEARPDTVKEDAEEFMYAMKIENLLEPTEAQKKAGITKK